MIILDVYCGEGGAGAGFRRAGFNVVGIDLNDDWSNRRTRARPKPLKRYPFPSFEGEAIAALERLIAGEKIVFEKENVRAILGLEDFVAIHASPPCQLYSEITRIFDRRGDGFEHPDLVAVTRDALERTGLPYTIENVEGAPLHADAILLCGSMFDPPLDVRRHRLFETNWGLGHPVWGCRHKLWSPRYRSADYRGRKSGKLMSVVPVYGGTRYPGDVKLRRRVMEMPWGTNQGVVEAIPPRYTEWIGGQLQAHLLEVAA